VVSILTKGNRYTATILGDGSEGKRADFQPCRHGPPSKQQLEREKPWLPSVLAEREGGMSGEVERYAATEEMAGTHQCPLQSKEGLSF
jgi:hypothetical protein